MSNLEAAAVIRNFMWHLAEIGVNSRELAISGVKS